MRPEQMMGASVSAGYFEVVGVHPMIGRSFLPEELRGGKKPCGDLGACFLAEPLWC